MLPLNGISLVNPVSSQAAAQTTATDDEQSTDSGQPAPVKSPLVVNISLQGQDKLKGEQDKYADIDATQLPDSIKKYLKAIRDLQEKIAAKLQELQDAMGDRSLSEKEREAKISKINLEVSVMNGVLISTTDDLHQKETELRLQAPDLGLINGLMAPGKHN